jgi:hypothetical protein
MSEPRVGDEFRLSGPDWSFCLRKKLTGYQLDYEQWVNVPTREHRSPDHAVERAVSVLAEMRLMVIT